MLTHHIITCFNGKRSMNKLNGYCLFICFFAGKDDENERAMEEAAVVRGEPLQDGNHPPKVESAVEILQEKVTKQIIKEGHGQKPTKYATCFCKLHFFSFPFWVTGTVHYSRKVEVTILKINKSYTIISYRG